MKQKKAWKYLFISAAIIFLDQLSKWLVIHYLTFAEPKKLLPFFNLTVNFNPGAAFSFLGSASGWQVYLFSLVSFIVAILLITWLLRAKKHDVWIAIGLSLIIGGALGNFIDRVRLGFVIDFFDFHIKTWHFATFNVADSAICVGTFLLLTRLLFTEKLK